MRIIILPMYFVTHWDSDKTTGPEYYRRQGAYASFHVVELGKRTIRKDQNF